jgi:hypothetical protein
MIKPVRISFRCGSATCHEHLLVWPDGTVLSIGYPVLPPEATKVLLACSDKPTDEVKSEFNISA